MYKEVAVLKVDKELMRGSTTMIILSLLNEEDMYGYQIISKLKKLSDSIFNLKEGTLYPILHGLENKGCITSYWVDGEAGRKRKYYKITEEGLKFLKNKQKEWKLYTEVVNKIVGDFCYE